MNKEQHKKFIDEVTNPMIFAALTVVIAAIAFDYAFQIVEMLELL